MSLFSINHKTMVQRKNNQTVMTYKTHMEVHFKTYITACKYMYKCKMMIRLSYSTSKLVKPYIYPGESIFRKMNLINLQRIFSVGTCLLLIN